ncbi:MAG: hypothetical protein E7517_09055 [Ruminococcaceae bacterium]|nr:hypothetical protein [Oscillospiraceae bacterium]
MQQKPSFGNRILQFLGFDADFKSAIPSMINYNWAVFLANGSFYIIGLFLIPFLTKVEGLSTAQAGIVALCAKLCDAVTDPIMGIITDRTRSKFGRHRPWLLIGLVPVMFTYFGMWYSFGISNAASTIKMIYFTGMYMLFSTAYTIVIVPHTAMLPVLAPKYNLRTQYNSVKTIIDAIGTEGSFIIATLILSYTAKEGKPFLGNAVAAFGNTPQFNPSFKGRFMVMGLVLCLFFSLPLLATFFGTKEPSSKEETFPKFSFKEFIGEYKSIWSSRAFRQYFALSLFNCLSLSFISNTSYYFLDNVAGMVSLYAITTFIAQAGEAAGFPLNYAISINLSKQAPAKIELPFIVLALTLSFFVHKGSPTFLLILVYIFYNFGLAGVNTVTSNIFPDVTDVDEMISGERREGKIATFSTLIKKIISGISAALTGFILHFFGFHPNAAENTPTALFGVRFTYAILPIIFICLSIAAVYRYKMKKKEHMLILEAIKQKKETGTVTLTPEEKRTCEEIAGHKFEEMWIGQ